MSEEEQTLESKSTAELVQLVQQLEETLERAENNVNQLETRIQTQRATQVEKVKVSEAEEEFITIKLFKRLEEIKGEKSKLLRLVEHEEDYLTTTLQQNVQKLQEEKIDLENKLEIEEEFIVNKLQKQLEELSAEKNMLEHQFEEESASTVEVRKLRIELDEFRKKSDKEITKLKQENTILLKELSDLMTRFDKISTEKLELLREIENAGECTFNTSLYNTTSHRRGHRSNPLKKGWLNVKEDNSSELSTQYLVLYEKALIGFENENFEHLPQDAELTAVEVDNIDKVAAQENSLTITLKNGKIFTLVGTDTPIWHKHISSVIPT